MESLRLNNKSGKMTSHSDSELASVSKVATLRYKAKEKLSKKDFMKVFRCKNTEPDQQKLLTAVSMNNTESVANQLENGANPNSSDIIGRSALHLAASRGYTDIVRILLEYGADPNRQDIVQNTPLHLAACNNNLQIITLLINGGSDLTSADMNGRNPLQLAVSRLQLLKKSWKKGALEIAHIKTQVQEIVDIMISLWKRKESSRWGHHRENVDDLELMKHTLRTGEGQDVDCQMDKLLLELEQFSIK